MNNGKIRHFRDAVMQTECYQSMTPIAQVLSLKRNNLNHLEHGYNVAMNIGYDKWEAQSGFSFRNKEIVKQLLNKEL